MARSRRQSLKTRIGGAVMLAAARTVFAFVRLIGTAAI
jgi:hypothetical protein